MKIRVGTVPADGSRIVPSTDLANLVNTTQVYDVEISDFDTAEVAFVTSDTDAPATSTRNRATTWFKRGEGVLYHWHVFTPTEGPNSGVTEGRWVAASGNRREMIVEHRFPVTVAGGILRQTNESHLNGIYGVQLMAHEFMMPRVFQSLYTSHTDVTTISDTTASWMNYWAEHHTDPIFATVDTTPGAPILIANPFNPGDLVPCGWSGHNYKVAVECGYCTMAVNCDYTGPGKLVLMAGVNDARFMTPTGATLKSTDIEVGFALTSTVTHTVLGFLRPSVTHRNF